MKTITEINVDWYVKTAQELSHYSSGDGSGTLDGVTDALPLVERQLDNLNMRLRIVEERLARIALVLKLDEGGGNGQ